ncbi:MAG TPA: aldehyde dehydrogenase family protein [Terriglobales bacterium]|nr:aldehyde dehydrogenase family protein [Terriglobales bacterium]
MATTAEIQVASAKSYIAGKWADSRGSRRVERRNPADSNDVVGSITLATREDARQAIAAAQAAFPAWKRTSPITRGKLVMKVAQIMAARVNELAAMLTREEGKTLSESRGEILRSINVLEFIAGEARTLGGEVLPSELPKNFAYTLRVPLGVVSCITPWNFPVAIPVWKIAPALVGGNTVVFKPATTTAFTAMMVVSMFEEAGVPAGVLNMVVGAGSDVGDELVTNPAVRAISFTGSNEVGNGVYRGGANRGVRVQCEMGGKNPIIVLADADLDLAVASTVQGAFGSTGQRCTATSRAVVEESIADEFVRRVRDAAQKLKVGNGAEAGVMVGPIVDEKQFSTVLKYLEVGKQEGATVVCGGSKLTGGAYDRGLFVAPTIFDHVKPTMRIATEEIFGPVLSVIRVRNFDEAMQVANGVAYGLSSAIYTRDASRIFDFVDEIDTGIVHINSPTTGGEAHVPFGGMKATGVGQREQGTVALDFFTEIKAVYVDYTGAKREGNLY